MDQVHKFYRFWDNFKTWREFSQYNEYDPEEAGDRYERRWMEKENKKLTKEYEVAERKRLIKMVELAWKKDPRIQKMVEAEAAEKARAKAEKKEAKIRQAQEREDMVKK